jgi:hypothetical protein
MKKKKSASLYRAGKGIGFLSRLGTNIKKIWFCYFDKFRTVAVRSVILCFYFVINKKIENKHILRVMQQ